MNRTLRALGATAALALLGVLPTAGPAQARGPEATGAPTVGTCYDLTEKQLDAMAVPEAPVRCDQPHTASVYAVRALPARLTWHSKPAAVNAAVTSRCRAAFAQSFGSSVLQYARSQYGYAFYAPTVEQQGAGARWFDCLAVVYGAHDLAPLPVPPPRLSAHLPDSVATCATRTLANTVCSQRHAWRVTHAFFAAGAYTTKNVDRAAEDGCPLHVTSARWLQSSVDVPGRRFVVTCYSQTTH